jgi:hypothetical protein
VGAKQTQKAAQEALFIFIGAFACFVYWQTVFATLHSAAAHVIYSFIPKCANPSAGKGVL